MSFLLRCFLTAALACLPPAAGVAGALTLEGPLEQGGMVVGHVSAGSKVSLDGRRLSVSDAGVFVIGFDRDAPPDAELEVIGPGVVVEHHSLHVSQRQYQVERIEGLPPSQVSPGPEALKRIRRESAMLAEARSIDAPRTDFMASFTPPVSGRVTGVFGSQRILNGEPRRPHYGIDYAAAKGTPIKAPAPGVITLVNGDMYFSGGTVILDHGQGISSVFIHLSRIDVRLGQHVKQGEVIGAVGATGRATGPHLHWGVNWFDKRLDPELLLQQRR